MNSSDYTLAASDNTLGGWAPRSWQTNDLSSLNPAYQSLLSRHSKDGAYIAFLDCAFDAGGPWAGVSTLYKDILLMMDEQYQELFAKYSFELVQVLPHLRHTLVVKNPTLTDLATDEEKVRNYAADRAYRVIHGLIDVLDEYSDKLPVAEPVFLICHRFDDAGVICKKFFVELLRRRAHKLHIHLVLGVKQSASEDTAALFKDHSLVEIVSLVPDIFNPSPVDRAGALQKAEEIELQVGSNRTAIQSHLPELISLWEAADNPSKVLKWRLHATAFYCNLGLYEDALRYGEGLLEFAASRVPNSEVLQWWIANKMLNAYTGLGNAEQGLKLAEGDAARLATFVDPIWRSQLLYLTAMLYSRYSSPRDYAKGEAYLNRALAIIDTSAISEEDRHFQRVFNRNGLAMIRSFQGRHDEAIALCRNGIEALTQHLGSEKHMLHRSILHYNVAQVYAATLNYDEALVWYAAAMNMDPNYSEYYNERGNIYFKMGSFKEAYRDYIKAVELSPPYYEVLTNLGQCERALGDYDAAISSYTRALDLQPNHILATEGRAKAFEEKGCFAEAERDYSAALEQNDSSWEVVANRAVMRYCQGNIQGCMADLNHAILLKPDQPGLYQNRALAFSALGKSAEATRDLTAALTMDLTPHEQQEIREALNAFTSISGLTTVADVVNAP